MEYREREKEKVDDRPAKLNEKKRDRELEGKKKAKETYFLEEEQHEKFVAVVRKWEMLADTKVKVNGSEKKRVTITRTTFPSKNE